MAIYIKTCIIIHILYILYIFFPGLLSLKFGVAFFALNAGHEAFHDMPHDDAAFSYISFFSLRLVARMYSLKHLGATYTRTHSHIRHKHRLTVARFPMR